MNASESQTRGATWTTLVPHTALYMATATNRSSIRQLLSGRRANRSLSAATLAAALPFGSQALPVSPIVFTVYLTEVSVVSRTAGAASCTSGGMPSASAGIKLSQSRLPCPITVTVTTQTTCSNFFFHTVATLSFPATSYATTAPRLPTRKSY